MMRGLAGKLQMTAGTLPSEPGALAVWPRLSCPLGAAAFGPSLLSLGGMPCSVCVSGYQPENCGKGPG